MYSSYGRTLALPLASLSGKARHIAAFEFVSLDYMRLFVNVFIKIIDLLYPFTLLVCSVLDLVLLWDSLFLTRGKGYHLLVVGLLLVEEFVLVSCEPNFVIAQREFRGL